MVSTLVTLLGLGAIVYLAGGYLVLPYLIKPVATRILARHLDRPVTIGQVEFDPFTLRLTLVNGIIGPRLSDPSDKVDPILSFSTLIMNLEARSLPQRAIICRELSINQPFIHLVHDQMGYNISTLIQPSAQSGTSGRGLWAIIGRRYSINNIVISNGEIVFDDLPTAKVHHLEELNVTLPAIANINYQDGRVAPRFSAVLNGTPLEMSGRADLAEGPMTARLSLKMTNLDLAAYKDYLPPGLGVRSLSGQADLSLDLLYAAAATQAERLRLMGAITLRAAQASDGQDQLSVESGLVKGWLAPLANQFQAEEITLRHPIWQRLSDQASPWPALVMGLLRPAASQQSSLPVNHLQISQGEIKGRAANGPGQPGDWQAIDLSVNTAQAAGDRSGAQQTFFSLNAQNIRGSQVSLQGSGSTSPFVVKGLLGVSKVDVAIGRELWETAGIALPVVSGMIEQVQSNFSLSLDPEQHPLLLLEPLNIQAKDLRFEQNGQVLEVPVWQSEQGSFKLSDSLLRLGKVRLQQARLACRRQSSTGAWQTIVSQAEGQTPPPPRFSLDSLEITNGSLLIENQGPPDIGLHLERFDLQVDAFASDQPNSLSAAAMLDDKYPVQATGTFSLTPFSATLNVQGSDLPLPVFQPVLDHYFAGPMDGTLSVDGTLNLPSLEYRGQWAIDGLSAPPISCRRVSAEGTVFTLRPLSFVVDRLNLQGAGLQLTANPNGMPQFPVIMNPGWQPASAPETAAVAIKAIDLSDGSLIYDFPGPPGFTISSQKINGNVSDLIVAKSQSIPFTINGRLENRAEFKAQGAITPFASQPGLALTSEVKGLPLTALAPLLEPYWGFGVKGGTLDFDNHLTFEDTLIHDNSHLLLRDLDLGNPLATPAIKAIGNTWQSLPLVQAMLQDSVGTIELTVPIDGRTDTGFTYPIGMKTFLNQLLLKAAVSPINLLRDSQQALSDTVEFKPGSSRLDVAAEDQLKDLAALLQDRPLLAVRLVGLADSSADSRALLHPPKAIGSRQPAKGQGPISEKTLLNLATRRGQVAQKFLTGQGVSPRQVSLAPAGQITSGKAGRPGNRIAISLSVLD